MKKFFLYAILLSTTVLSSCIEDDEVISTPECAITAFSVGDITCTLHTKAYDGGDSTYTKKVQGSSIVFNIDQINGRIYPTDSLESWIDVTHIVPSITSNGVVAVHSTVAEDSLFHSLSSTDSLDLTYPYDIAVIAYNGTSYKRYTLEMPKKQEVDDTLRWEVDDSTANIAQDFKIHVLQNEIYSFGKDDTEVDYSSVVLFKDKFYALDGNQMIKTSQDGQTWEPTGKQAQALLAADEWYLYAWNGTEIVCADETMQTWTSAGVKDLNYLPNENVSYVAYSRDKSGTTQDVVMVGRRDGKTEVWHKVSSNNEMVNEDWQRVVQSSLSSYVLPQAEVMSNVVRADDLLLVLCDTTFYISEDNGISWYEMNETMAVPEDMKTGVQTRLAVTNNTLWLWQSGEPGKKWKGDI